VADPDAALRRARAQAQLLRPAPDGGPSATAAVRRLLAVQAQDARAARLALRARVAGLRAADLDAAPLVVAWLNRGTLHLVADEDWPWLLALTAPGRATANRRRLAQEGVDEAAAVRALAAIDDALGARGPLTRAELAAAITGAGTRAEGQATPHLLMRCALEGRVVAGLDGRWRRTDPPALLDEGDRDELLARLARRYLAAHAPAEPEDLARWAGLALGEARRGFAAVEPELAAACLLPPAPAPLPPRLLPGFDPYLLGWRDRSFAVAPEHERRVFPGGGMLRATVVADGVAVGTWSLRAGRVSVEPFGDPVDAAAEIADVERFAAGP
jgi:hypothetical protein